MPLVSTTDTAGCCWLRCLQVLQDSQSAIDMAAKQHAAALKQVRRNHSLV
jgi:hypothetical protein